jgi:Flp pilus assembly protein protease CpaA
LPEFSPIDLLRILSSISLLAYSAVQDVDKREIDDTVWVLLLLAALVLNLGGALAGSVDIWSWLFLGSLQSMLFWELYSLGAYGGADAKSLVCISFMYPTTLDRILQGLTSAKATVPLSTFDNAMVLSLVYLLMNSVLNVRLWLRGVTIFEGLENESWIRKAAALFLLRKVSAQDLSHNPNKFLLAEASGTGGSRRIVFSRDLGRPLASDVAEGSNNYVFASPLMPLQLFVLLGLGLALLFGDLILLPSFWLVRSLPGI